jgi:RNA recognition motif-containing protein
MRRKLYVGNLAYRMTNSDLEQLFAAHGAVQSAQIIMDRDTGRSKGFGFVEMSTDQEAQAAASALNGQEVEGRSLTVNEARPRPERGSDWRTGNGGSRDEYGSRAYGGAGTRDHGGSRRY